MDAVQEIKDRLSVEDVVGSYVDLKRSGASYKGLCPFHNEKTPSFYVTPSRGTYHCFGCGKGGDVFAFLMETERISFPEALKRLASRAGITLPEQQEKTSSLRSRLYEINAEAVRFFGSSLRSERGAQARSYLLERGFEPQITDSFEIGYAPDTRESLIHALREAGYDDRIILSAGLAIQDEIGGKIHDRFRGRLIFPIRDASGRTRGFGGRSLGKQEPKYLNSPQTEIFDKSSVLFAADRAQEAIRKAHMAVLVEGYLDAIRAHAVGHEYVVASLGTAVTTQQMRAVSRLANRVILALDPDPAGQAAAARSALLALAELNRSSTASESERNVDVRIARLPVDKGDPDELIRDDPSAWEEALRDSVPAFEFYFQQTLAALDKSSENWRQLAVDRLLPIIQQFGGRVGWQAMWIERLARETGIDPRALQSSMPSRSPRARRRPLPAGSEDAVRTTTSRSLASDPSRATEESLLSLLLNVQKISSDDIAVLEDVQLQEPQNDALLKVLLEAAKRPDYTFDQLLEGLPAELTGKARELRDREAPVLEERLASVAIAYHVARLKYFFVQSRLRRTTELLGELSDEDLQQALDSASQLMSDRREVEESLENLSKLVAQGAMLADAPQGTIDQDSGRL